MSEMTEDGKDGEPSEHTCRCVQYDYYQRVTVHRHTMSDSSQFYTSLTHEKLFASFKYFHNLL